MPSKYWSFSYSVHASEAPKKNFDWSAIKIVSYAVVRVDISAFIPEYVVVSGYIETKKPCYESVFSEFLPEAKFRLVTEPVESDRDDILKNYLAKDTLGPWEYGHWADFDQKEDLEKIDLLLKMGYTEKRVHDAHFDLWAKYRDVIKSSIEIRAQNPSLDLNRTGSFKRNLPEAGDTQ